MTRGVFKLKDGTELAIDTAHVVNVVNDVEYPLSEVLDGLNERLASFYLPLYFSTTTDEIHTTLPEGVTTVKLISVSNDIFSSTGLSLLMDCEFEQQDTLTLSCETTGTETDCTNYAGKGVIFTLSGVNGQNIVSAMLLFS